MATKTVGLQSPWVTYYKMIYNLFSMDSEIKVSPRIIESEGGNYSFWIESTNSTKILALSRLLKNKIVMGNITLTITFRCADTDIAKAASSASDIAQDFKDGFNGNPYFSKIVSELLPTGDCVYYAVFAHEIISFYNDNLIDYHGNTHMIVADLVEEITNENKVYICTEYEAVD